MRIGFAGSDVEAELEAFIGDDGVPVLQVDTAPGFGTLRINVNDGLAWMADPERG